MMPHKARLWAIVILTVLDLALLIAAQYVDPALLGQIEPLVEPVLGAVLLIASPALVDAVAVERRRRDPSRPAIPDDVIAELERRSSDGERAMAERGRS